MHARIVLYLYFDQIRAWLCVGNRGDIDHYIRTTNAAAISVCVFQSELKNSQNEKSMRVPVLVYLILSRNVLHEWLQNF